MSLYQRDGTGSRYLKGDLDPKEFSWNDKLNKNEFLTMLQRNGKIRKATAWVAREACRPRFVLRNEKSINGTKFGKPYLFPSIIEYLEWIGFFDELEKCLTWSRLFGDAIMVMYKEGEGELKEYEPVQGYDLCQAYHPLANGTGYQIQPNGRFLITFRDRWNNTKNFTVDPSRIIPFHAPKLELTWEGSSCVEPLMKLAIVQEQMFRSVMQRLHMMGGGVAVMQCTSEDEKAILENSITKSLSYLDRIYTNEDDLEKVIKLMVPDLNANQFREIWDIAQEEIATDMNMSKKLISGDPQGAISSAKWDVEVSYTEIYQTQRHYKKDIEYVLYYLGIEDTTFDWNDPFPTEYNQEEDDLNARPSTESRQ